MRLTVFVARMGGGGGGGHREFLMGYLKVGSYLEDIVVNGRIILKWALKKSAWLGVVWINLSRKWDR